jgi:hypothetical protein
MSQSSMTGASSWGLTGMIWLNFKRGYDIVIRRFKLIKQIFKTKSGLIFRRKMLMNWALD